MLITSWLRLLASRMTYLRLLNRGREHHKPRGCNAWASRGARAALSFERLEERMLLATITVNSVLDNTTADDFLTLREAKTIVNDGNIANGIAELGNRMLTAAEAAQISTLIDPLGTNDIIAFDASLNGTPILFNSGMDLFKSVTILGNGAANTVLDGQLNDRLFKITGTNVNITFDGLTLQNGRTTDADERGGAIRSLATGATVLSIQNSILSGNSTTGQNSEGGAIFASGGTIVVGNSRFIGNSTSGYDAEGGAISTYSGTVNVSNSILSGNSTSNDYAQGGAIYTNNGAVTLTNSSLIGNSTSGQRSVGGAVYVAFNTVTVSNSTLAYNVASGNLSSGGAIHTRTSDIVVTNSTLSGNSARESGGAIYARYGSATLVNSTVAYNFGSSSVGGVFAYSSLTIHNSIIALNSAGASNPDIFSANGLSVSHSLIGDARGTLLTEDHAASVTNGIQTASYIGLGGGLGIGTIDPGLAPLSFNGGRTRTHALVSGSLALNSGSNALAVDDMAAALVNDQRGAPFTRFSGTVDMGAYERQTVAGLTLVVDNATDEEDGDYSAGDLSLREAIGLANGSVGTDTITFAASINGLAHLFTLGQVTITESLTITGNGAANTVIDAQQLSRIFDITAGAIDTTLDGLTLRNGLSSNNSGGAIRSLADSGTLLTIRNSILTGNQTLGDFAYGGAIEAFASNITIENSTISGNSTSDDGARGGAIHTIYGSVTVTNSTFQSNSTGGNFADGGAIYALFGDVTVTNSQFLTNSARGGGGAIFTQGGDLTITNSTFHSNSANGGSPFGNGGAINVHADGNLTVIGSTFSNNFANYDGGAIYHHTNGNIVLINSTLSGNQAFDDGGAIYAESVAVSLINSTVFNNYATNEGGGIVTYEYLSIQNSIVAHNFTETDWSDINQTPDVLQHSLIGHNNGTSLTETGAGAPDANGNYIGGTSGGDINPLLGPLQNNGGLTQTHALLPGSLALNGGNNALAVDPTNGNAALSTDQRGLPFVRIFDGTVDMGAYESQVLALVVDTASDEDDGDYSAGDLSLREAVRLANENVGFADIITFGDGSAFGGTNFLDATPDTIFLALGQIEITESVTIQGNGALQTIIDARPDDMTPATGRIFLLSGGTETITFDGLTLQNGHTTGDFNGGGAIRSELTNGTVRIANSIVTGNSTAGFGARGGAFYNTVGPSQLNVINSTFSNNSTSVNYSHGGAIASRGNLVIQGSTFSNNSTTASYLTHGGAILGDGPVTITNSTFSGNSVAGDSSSGGAIAATDHVTVINSTLTGNSSALSNGGAINTFGSNLTIRNSIVAGNTAGGTGNDLLSGGTLTVEHSLIGDNTGTGLAATDHANGIADANGNYIGGGAFGVIDVTTVLNTTLALNGAPAGSPLTHALLPGSLALNSGSNALAVDPTNGNAALATDQRGAGFARIVGTTVDMGAYEEQSADFGDLPDTYGTTLASNGARHTATGPTLGATRDTEADGVPTVGATGDGADEDGVTASGPFVVGRTTNIIINVQGGSGFINAWADLNRNGNFNDPGEQILTNFAVTVGNNVVPFAIPDEFTPGDVAIRARLTSASVASPSPTGLLPDGEVEDYIITVNGVDFGDLPDSYGTTLANDGARHAAIGPTLGATRDTEANGQPSPLADGDGADEDGISGAGPLVAGVPTNLTINVQGGSGFVNAWVDANRDGDFDDPGELVLMNLVVTAGDNVIPVLLPANFLPGPIATRFRLTSTAVISPTPTGYLPDGEVEDYLGVTTNPYLTIDGNTWNFHGTAGMDNVVVDLPNRIVTINGIAFQLLPNVTDLTLDGAGGNDRLTLIGTAGNEVVEIRPEDVRLLSSASGLTLHSFDVEYNDVVGNGGNDQATFFDSAGVDRFSGRTTQSRMYGTGFDNVAQGFATVIAKSLAGGADIAYLTDTAGDDVFSASYTLASVSGTGISAEGFGIVVGYSTGGNDKAILNGTSGKDVFLGGQSLSSLSQGTLSQGASGFKQVVAKSGGGTEDIARLTGTALVDQFSGGPTASSLLANTPQGQLVYRLDALSFANVVGVGVGGNDRAVLQDSSGNDDFYGRTNRAYIVGPQSTYEAQDFSHVTIRATTGVNKRHIIQPLGYTLAQTGNWR